MRLSSVLRLKKNPDELLDFVKKRSAVSVPSISVVESAAELSVKYGLSSMDALLYTSAILNNAQFITGDNDFRAVDDVIVIR